MTGMMSDKMSNGAGMMGMTGMPAMGMGAATMPAGPMAPNMVMVPRCTMKMEKISNGMKLTCSCEDMAACTMMQNLCSMMAGGMCSMVCTMNGMMVCTCNMCMCNCKVEMTKDGCCVTCTSGDAACCAMVQGCCDCMMACMKAGCTCCLMMGGTPVCCCVC